MLTVLLWLEFTCIWNSLARQILWTDPGTIFQCCYNTLLTAFLRGLHGCCLGRRGRAPLNGSSKCLNYPRTLYKYQFFTARYLIFDHSVPWPSSWAGSVFSIHSGIHRPDAPLSRTIFMGNESNPRQSSWDHNDQELLKTEFPCPLISKWADIKTNHKDSFQAILFIIWY